MVIKFNHPHTFCDVLRKVGDENIIEQFHLSFCSDQVNKSMPEKSTVSVSEMSHSSYFLWPRIAAAPSSGPAEDGRWWPERGEERRAPVEQ